VERLSCQGALDSDLDPKRLACPLRCLQRAQLRAAQTQVDVRREPCKRNPDGIGLSHASLSQRTLVVRGAVRRFGVSQQPEHGQTLRGAAKWSFAGRTKARGLDP